MEKKYPVSLFIFGFISNVVGRFFFLFFPAVILIIIGIWLKVGLIIGLSLLGLDVLLSFAEQLNIRNATMKSDNPNFKIFQDAILSKNWKNNIMDILEDKISEDQDNDGQEKN